MSCEFNRWMQHTASTVLKTALSWADLPGVSKYDLYQLLSMFVVGKRFTSNRNGVYNHLSLPRVFPLCAFYRL